METVGVPSKVNQRITILPHHSPSEYVVKRHENNRCSNIFLLTQKNDITENLNYKNFNVHNIKYIHVCARRLCNVDWEAK